MDFSGRRFGQQKTQQYVTGIYILSSGGDLRPFSGENDQNKGKHTRKNKEETHGMENPLQAQ